MRDEHEQNALKLAITQNSPDIQQLVDEMEAKASH
jgi:hypothetical protein